MPRYMHLPRDSAETVACFESTVNIPRARALRFPSPPSSSQKIGGYKKSYVVASCCISHKPWGYGFWGQWLGVMDNILTNRILATRALPHRGCTGPTPHPSSTCQTKDEGGQWRFNKESGANPKAHKGSLTQHLNIHKVGWIFGDTKKRPF